MKAYIKLFCEVIPLIVFFLVNSYEKVIIEEIPLEGIFQATFYFIIVSIIVIPIAWYIDRKIPWMPIVTGAFLIVFGRKICASNNLHFLCAVLCAAS